MEHPPMKALEPNAMEHPPLNALNPDAMKHPPMQNKSLKRK